MITEARRKPSILIIFNTYLNKGGEDSVVSNEIQTLKKYHYEVHYKEYDNTGFKSFSAGSLLAPLNIFFNVSAFIRTFLYVWKRRIDVVHVHNVFYTASPSVFWGARLAGAKTVYTVHNYRLFCLNGHFFRNGRICTDCRDRSSFRPGVTHRCFKQSRVVSGLLAASTLLHWKFGSWTRMVDRYIAINPFIAQLLTEKGIPAERICLKPNYSKDFGFSDYMAREDFYFFAGRLQDMKGVEHLIEAFKRSGKRLVVAGTGDLADWVKEQVTHGISYIGQQSREQMNVLYKTCKAVVFPSIWLEGMPMAIIEAQSAGAIPIVASTVTTKAMVTPGEDGFLYEAGSPDALIQAILDFEKLDPEVLNSISGRARKKFEQEYEEIRHIDIMENVYATDN